MSERSERVQQQGVGLAKAALIRTSPKAID